MEKKLLQQLALQTVALLVVHHSSAQGTFTDLNFEQAGTNPPNLPGWTLYSGSVFYNTVSIGGAAITIHDSVSTHFQPIQGNYSVLLQGSSAGPPTSAAIGQTGQIPAGSLSLRFWAFPASNLQVTFGGQLISTYKLTSTANYDVFGGDISMFAGQTAELRFTGLANSGGYFDNIFFSAQQIPEPGIMSLFSLGTIFVSWRFLQKRTWQRKSRATSKCRPGIDVSPARENRLQWHS